jgi:hypothetical protein
MAGAECPQAGNDDGTHRPLMGDWSIARVGPAAAGAVDGLRDARRSCSQ